ncbi:hypothetical protein FA10DRAFT_28810 [Acaromyces ingoldii]|uniref:Uncharacterized protein n=1 Tax=Acaromyces ingoldii TaxID=215250 RepID=A0A316Z073_9BASI|nr:hypothetical protein FA10DRAFT_28810 [Acaromyces ingoldii]PWN93693.1 hypothetical protein FA10DRAFT_28810 [Acaromyces ingoldii]
MFCNRSSSSSSSSSSSLSMACPSLFFSCTLSPRQRVHATRTMASPSSPGLSSLTTFTAFLFRSLFLSCYLSLSVFSLFSLVFLPLFFEYTRLQGAMFAH